MKRETYFYKVLETIWSCKTTQQLQITENFIENYNKRFPSLLYSKWLENERFLKATQLTLKGK